MNSVSFCIIPAVQNIVQSALPDAQCKNDCDTSENEAVSCSDTEMTIEREKSAVIAKNEELEI